MNEEEYSKLLENFNNDTNIYMSKINHYENYLNMNMNENEKKILKIISEIVEKYSKQNSIDLIFNEDQYFISSSSIDISDIVIEKLNDQKIDFKIGDQ